MRILRGFTACVAAILLCGCASQKDKPSSSPSVVSPHPSPASSSTTPPSPVPAAEGASTNTAGNITKKLGEAGQLVTSQGDVLAEVSVISVTVEKSCHAFDGSIYQPQGALYKLQLNAYLANTPEATEANALNFIVVEADTFTLHDKDGTNIEQTGRHASNACLNDTERISPSILPGEKTQGFIYIEAPEGATSVTWNPWGVSGSGWEWKL